MARTPGVRRLYATGQYSQKELGDMFGMSAQTVSTLVGPQRISVAALKAIKPEIRRLYVEGNHTLAEIAAVFDIGISSVHNAQTSESRKTRRRLEQGRRSARHDAMGEDWKTGDYTLDQLSEKWDCTRTAISIGLKEAGTSGRDKQYMHKRIRELYAAGQTHKALAKRYGYSEHWIARLIWKASDAPERTCPQCGTRFRPKRNACLFCKTDCRIQHKVEKICAVCAKSYRTNHRRQRTCSPKCNGVWRKIQSIDRGLKLRELRRAGCSDALISRKTGSRLSTIVTACARGRRGTYLAAIEALNKHSGEVELSPAAQSVVGWAWGVLTKEGLHHYMRTRINSSQRPMTKVVRLDYDVSSESTAHD